MKKSRRQDLVRRPQHSLSKDCSSRRRRSQSRHAAVGRLAHRALTVQSLEQRQLLAGDLAPMQNTVLPEDVDADGIVSTADAFLLVNQLSRPDSNSRPGSNLNALAGVFADVNGDGIMTARDALRVINRLSRGESGAHNAPSGGTHVGPAHEGIPGDEHDGIPGDEGAPGDEGRRGDKDRTGDNANNEPLEVRSIDGTGNNLDQPLLGSAGTELRRLVDADYADGISQPAGQNRASAREISNIVFAQEDSVLNDRGLSDLAWQWGQFVDHDIDLTGGGNDESFDIAVPAGDPYFDPTGTGDVVISLTRSGIAEGTGVDQPAEQFNEITAFIDGSQIYGSDEATAVSLRTFQGGRLLTSEGNLLPIGDDGFFQAGDIRANEQQALTSMHTLWVREHNSIADRINANDPSLTDEEIYQRARAIVIGELQAITFNEYLPALLGRDAIPTYSGYDSTVDPTISNLFATAAFRYGHTSLSSELQRMDDDGNTIDEGNVLLRDAFFNPTDVIELGIEPLLKGLASNVSQEIDTLVVDDVRNFLFGPPGSGGFDLVSLNIQRGRDHGLPDYNSARQELGLPPAESFADITSDPQRQAKLQEAYGTVDDIDVWVGALAEDHVDGASVGELTRAVLVEQFTALRDGDRLWYQNTFNGRQLREIDSTRLSDVIERNTDLTSIQENAFFVADRPDRDRIRQEQNHRGDPQGTPDDVPPRQIPINLMPMTLPPASLQPPNPTTGVVPNILGDGIRGDGVLGDGHTGEAPPARSTGPADDISGRPTDQRGADNDRPIDPRITPPQNPMDNTALDPLAVDRLMTPSRR
tara:strand:- start:404134 stop:406575 length:2442 start_codon:yes stop_codon:yes gene_type:complete